MPTNFVLRSPYLPSNRSIKRLDAETPLAWFQSIWPRLRSGEGVTSEALLGIEKLYGFEGFARKIREEELEAPSTPAGLQELLSMKWYSNNVECRDGFVQVESDDDDFEYAFWWLSDEVFLAEQDRFACYAAEALPVDIGSGGFDPGFEVAALPGAHAEGAVYCVFSTAWDSGNLTDMTGPAVVPGVRLPGFAAFLQTFSPADSHPLEIDWLAAIARHNPGLGLPELLLRLAEVPPYAVDKHWKEVHAGTVSEDTLRNSARWGGRRQPPEVLGDPHVAELSMYDEFCWHAWFLFDELWASAHPALARSLLRFGMPFEE